MRVANRATANTTPLRAASPRGFPPAVRDNPPDYSKDKSPRVAGGAVAGAGGSLALRVQQVAALALGLLLAVNLYELGWPLAQERIMSLFDNNAMPATQRYTIVGVRGEAEFGKTVFFGRHLQDKSAGAIYVRALALPRDGFNAWLDRRVKAGVIREDFVPPAIFVEAYKGGPNIFLGGVSEWKQKLATIENDKIAAASQSQAEVPPSAAVQASLAAAASAALPPQVAGTQTLASDASPDGSDEALRENVASSSSSFVPLTTAWSLQRQQPAPERPQLATPHPPLLPQVYLKNTIITGYTASSEKKFTNYRFFASALTGSGPGPFRGWKFIYQGPMMASVILVQDQLSAQLASVKNPKGIVNNIGWGGQSCLGGTKGAQIQCRTNRALRDGCSYTSLNIQPPQYRLWVQEECRFFFDNMCRDKNSLWILKPSGGQHGSGMSVHQGCSPLLQDHGSCPLGEANRKKYFIMAYLEPALLDGHKFDVRSYILIASMQPALLFYHDGFVRRATTAYSHSNLGDKAAHITNAHEQKSDDDHFWDFDRLSAYLSEHAGFPPRFMQTTFRQHAKRVSEFVYFSAEPFMRKKRGKFQLFAVDWIVDARGGVHMLEVNSNPLVTAYPCKGFPETWTSLMDLVLTVQTRPQELKDPLVPGQFDFQGWELVYNEQIAGRAYNSCAAFASDHNTGPSSLAHTTLKSAEQVQSELLREQRDDEIINEDLDRERVMVGGARLEPWAPLDDAEAALQSVPFDGRPPVEYNCTGRQPGSTYDRMTCVLAQGSPDETPVHILSSGKPGPVVLIVAGLHGNEGAGVVAARHVAQYWTLQKGTLVVVERANARGVRVNSRLVPGSSVDLNRAFPPLHEPTVFMAKVLWELVLVVRPHVLLDLHEGRGFFAASGVKEEVNRNVGSTVGTKGASKGSSIVASVEAQPLAKTMVAPVNAAITDPEHRFLIISPPIEGGLAAKVNAAFGTRSMVLETTLLLPLEDRVRQHLVLISTGLRALQVLHSSFDFDAVGPPPEACVATRKGCGEDGTAVDSQGPLEPGKVVS